MKHQHIHTSTHLVPDSILHALDEDVVDLMPHHYLSALQAEGATRRVTEPHRQQCDLGDVRNTRRFGRRPAAAKRQKSTRSAVL